MQFSQNTKIYDIDLTVKVYLPVLGQFWAKCDPLQANTPSVMRCTSRLQYINYNNALTIAWFSQTGMISSNILGYTSSLS